MKTKNLKSFATVFALFFALGGLYTLAVGEKTSPNNPKVVFATTQHCPTLAGWTKIDSNDLSSYPVSGATQYCFKASTFTTNTIPQGGFDQEGRCEENHIERCGLSYWSYFVPSNTPTPTVTLTPTVTPTNVPSVTPTDVPNPTPTDVPSNSPTPTDTPNNTPTLTMTPTVTPADTPSVSPTPSPEPTGTVESESDSEDPGRGGQILGASTLAETGSADDTLFMIGFILLATSLYGIKFAVAKNK